MRFAYLLVMLKKFVKRIPVVGDLSVELWALLHGSRQFVGSRQYWEERYATGGNSGSGSYGRLATYKANVMNTFVEQKGIDTVIEFGCGDGHQLSLANYPSYTGLDVSATAIEICKRKFKEDHSKAFFLYDENYRLTGFKEADLALSLDVIYHLVEDSVFEEYMLDLFRSANSYIIIYASNAEGEQLLNFTGWISKSTLGWSLIEQIKNPYPYDLADPDNTSQSDFFIYAKSEITKSNK